jgi:hypothetical protein
LNIQNLSGVIPRPPSRREGKLRKEVAKKGEGGQRKKPEKKVEE